MKHGMRVIDTDLHLIEPLTLWDQRLPEPYRSQTRVAPDHEGHRKVTGYEFQIGERRFSPAQWLIQKQSLRRWQESPHLGQAQTDCNPELYLEGMDTEGVDLAVLVPTIAFLITTVDGVDPAHALALCRVYNDWAAEFARANPERFKFWAWVPRHDATMAAYEARRAVEQLGAAGVAITSGAVDGHLLSDAHFEPLWQEIERLDVPLGIHLYGSARACRDDHNGHRYESHQNADLVRVTLNGLYQGLAALPELIFGGVLERHPRLKPLVMEIGSSWLFWLLWRMDEEWELYHPDVDYTLSLKPSDYVRRQCFVTVDADEWPVRYLVDAGLGDNLVFTTDYPHHDCAYPEAVNAFVALEGISHAAKEKILWENATRLFSSALRADAGRPVPTARAGGL